MKHTFISQRALQLLLKKPEPILWEKIMTDIEKSDKAVVLECRDRREADVKSKCFYQYLYRRPKLKKVFGRTQRGNVVYFFKNNWLEQK